MSIHLTEKDQLNLEKLSSLHYSFNDLREYLDQFRIITSEIFRSEYNAILLFNSRLLSRNCVVDNNPEEFVKTYFQHIIEYDKPLHDLIENPRKIYNYHSEYSENRDVKRLRAEVQKLRPSGDWFYDSIIYRDHLIGFTGQVRGDGDQPFDTRDFFLQKLIKPLLYSGLQHFSSLEKTTLLNGIELDENTAFFFSCLSGAVEIPGYNNHIIEDAFQLKYLNEDSLRNHPMLGLINAHYWQREEIQPFTAVLNGSDGTYIIKAVRRNPGGSADLQILVTIEKDGEKFPFQSFKNQYGLTERELDIVRLIMKGYSNYTIAEWLFISESTVKRHIYNIFDKTGLKNRTQIVLAIVNP